MDIFKIKDLFENDTRCILIEKRIGITDQFKVHAYDLMELSPNGKYVLVRDGRSETEWLKVEILEDQNSACRIVDVLEVIE